MKPNFLIAGASRSGTSFLHSLLKQHPQVFLPNTKEILFFSREENFQKGIEWYESHFVNAQKDQLPGEASAPYFHKGIVKQTDSQHNIQLEDSAKRIKTFYPNIRIILTLRNPIERLFSQYQKNRRSGGIVLSLKDQLQKELSNPDQVSPAGRLLYKNNYPLHLENWFSHFNQDQLKVLIFEDWLRQPKLAMEEIESFLGLEPFSYILESGKVNPSKKSVLPWKRQKLKNETRSQLNKLFSPQIERLELLLNRSLAPWKANS